ncbi:MAG: hypothetical protein OER85_15190 [Gammaproteobacteria bacterium]|nr:hypothetical protein [Gammaproteobacteria bacterium]
MEVNFFLQNLGSFFRVRPDTAPASAPSEPGAVQPSRVDLLRARRQLLRVLDSLQEIDRLLNGKASQLSGLAAARSDPSLALNLIPSAALLQSIEEINATPTSFSPFVPGWGSGSTALLNLGGVYDGSQGSGALSFEVRQPGVHGVNRLRIRVRDPANKIIGNVTINQNDPLNQQYGLNNGLFFTLGAGNLVNRDTTSVQIFDTVGSVPDADKPFNGAGNDNPNLEFGLPGVIDGGFQLNGEFIPVTAGDSINDVLDTINQSSAGVTATLNPVTERIELLQDTPGPAPTIDLQGDTSNFLQAMKLDTAIVTPGVDADNDRPMADVAQFASVQNGSFLINGESIAVDPQADSFDDVIARITASAADVTASFDAGTKQLVITGNGEADFLTIDGNASGFFAATNIPEGIVEPTGRGRGFSQRQSGQIADAIENGLEVINEFFSNKAYYGPPGSQIAALRSQLKSAFISVLGGDGPNIDTGLGVVVNLDGVAKDYVRFARLDRTKLIRNLQINSTNVKRLFSGSQNSTGLIESVGKAAQRALQSLNSTLGSKGARFDAFA